jgi:hypothetical protein
LIRDRQAPGPQRLLTEINLTAERIARFFSAHAILINEVGERLTNNFFLMCGQFFGLRLHLCLESTDQF